jgi:dinuclear metal center YbgI/SA1388 family protein
MVSVAELLTALGRIAPDDKAAAWDPTGLQFGDPEAEVRGVGVAHEVTEAVTDAAIDGRLDLLITYHPLLLRPIGRLAAGPGPTGRAFRLIRSGVGVAVAHTSWDAAPGGTADALASALGLVDIVGFGPADRPLSDSSGATKLVTFVPAEHVDRVAQSLAVAGAGRIANYRGCSFRSEGVGTFLAGEGAHPSVGAPGRLQREPEVRLEMLIDRSVEAEVVAALVASHPYEEPAFDLYQVRSNSGLIGRVGELAQSLSLAEFSRTVAADLDTRVRTAGHPDRSVRRVAALPGSGGSHLDEVVGTGADSYVTGDLSHHQARACLDRGLVVIDPGHAGSERPGVAALFAAIRKIVPGAVDLTLNPDPWQTP